MSKDIYDVTIIGAGPAGATAAITLARKGRRVLLLDRATFPRTDACTAWISKRVKPLLDDMGLRRRSLLKTPFRDVTLYNADFSKSAKPVFSEPPGYLIDRSSFDRALVDYAEASKVTFIQNATVSDVQLQESSVIAESDQGHTYESKLLLMACGRESILLDHLGFSCESSGVQICTVHVEDAVPTGKGSRKPHIAVVLGLDGGQSFGLAGVSTDRVTVDVCWSGPANEAQPSLWKLCQLLAAHNIVPIDLSSQAQKARTIRNPPSAVMDFDSHVRKHTLLIGDAGGFVAAAGNEGIYPAMWSARIAAETLDEALNRTHTQDELMTFDSRWRMRMADYLRCPHTDIRFLLPLIFSNQPMADRMGAAMFLGENL